MKYILVLGIIFEKYKNPAKIKITTDQSLIDEFYLDQDKNPTFDFLDKITHNKEKMYKKHNQARLDKQFINQEELIDLMKKNNFHKCTYRNFSGGIVSIHTGWKL